MVSKSFTTIMKDVECGQNLLCGIYESPSQMLLIQHPKYTTLAGVALQERNTQMLLGIDSPRSTSILFCIAVPTVCYVSLDSLPQKLGQDELAQLPIIP